MSENSHKGSAMADWLERKTKNSFIHSQESEWRHKKHNDSKQCIKFTSWMYFVLTSMLSRLQTGQQGVNPNADNRDEYWSSEIY